MINVGNEYSSYSYLTLSDIEPKIPVIDIDVIIIYLNKYLTLILDFQKIISNKKNYL